jgi:hypothetical protein
MEGDCFGVASDALFLVLNSYFSLSVTVGLSLSVSGSITIQASLLLVKSAGDRRRKETKGPAH